MKSLKLLFGTGVVFAASAALAGAQTTAPATQAAPAAQVNPDAAAPATGTDNSTYATGKPLEMQSKEGFWGHVNPFARKKWVHRQIDPIADRANELDQLEAKNANDIKDVDARATAGVNRAMGAANAADAHAADAANRANQAQSTAVAANAHATSLGNTVANLDQFSKVSATNLLFVPGHTALSTKAKANLDDVATALASQKGYIVEVEGFSRSGLHASQEMTNSVVRYLVTAHQVPVYRIYSTALVKPTDADKEMATTDGTKLLTNGVRVTILHNSLGDANGTAATTAGYGSTTPSMQ